MVPKEPAFSKSSFEVSLPFPFSRICVSTYVVYFFNKHLIPLIHLRDRKAFIHAGYERLWYPKVGKSVPGNGSEGTDLWG